MTLYDKDWYEAQIKSYRSERMHECVLSTLITHKCQICRALTLPEWLLEMTATEKLTIELVSDLGDIISALDVVLTTKPGL